jgi:glycosyltransferase involved in cell wall biosynthesis|tara:strand:+ start:185 stop:976 length:792 start_codon:yes stop_codon:yes gene_type:complete
LINKNYISILITNYNKGKFLNKTLQTACSQSFKNYEIILFDDCSTDDSISIIKKFKKVKLITNKLNKKKKSGALNQINGIIQSFKKSKGNIICLLDGDDFFKKEKLVKIDQFFKNNKKLNCVFDIPMHGLAQFNFKNKKIKYSIWPTIFPTSCISLRRNFLINFLKNVSKKDFPLLEVDARLNIFSKFYMNEYNVLNKKMTYYNYDQDGITANNKKYSKKWWIRRSEAFSYLRNIIKKKRKLFIFSFDYYLTNFLTFLFKKVI